MENLIKILIVEDEMIIAAKTSMQLNELGYNVTGIMVTGEEAIEHVKENKPDLTLLDIHLKGALDGIETAKQLRTISDTAIIFLTANSDEETFNRAKEVKPAAFISKPCKKLQLQRTIELAICRLASAEEPPEDSFSTSDSPIILHDRIFVRHRERMIKIMVDEILYIEADRNYSRIFTPKKEFMLCLTLKAIEEKLSLDIFVRTHRSYIINVMKVDEVANGYVIIEGKPIPLSGTLRNNLMDKIQTL